MAADTGRLFTDLGSALLGVATLGKSEEPADPDAGHPDRPMRDRSLGEEGLNAIWCLITLGLLDREERIAAAAIEDRERE